MTMLPYDPRNRPRSKFIATSTGAAVNDAELLDELRTKLRRIHGNKDWTAKRDQAACELVREIVAIEGTEGLSEIFR
jgi:hypothetical protein